MLTETVPHFDPSTPRVLVTGAAGLLGRYVVHELLKHGLRVRGLDLHRSTEAIEWQTGDITSLDDMRRTTEGCFAVLHIAARPNIWSSDAVVGYTVHEGAMIPPSYIPVDTMHPLRATDPYAVSKILGEDIARSFALRGMKVITMRTVFVAYPEMECEIRARARDPDHYSGKMAGSPSSAGGGPLFNHIDPRDLVRAFWLALKIPTPGSRGCPFEAFFLAARDTLASEPTIERLERLLGKKVDVRDSDLYRRNPYASLYDLQPASAKLGFDAEYSLRTLIE